MTLLILALSRLHLDRESKDLCVYFVLDQSKSIPIDLKTQAFDYLNLSASDQKRRKDDRAGLIVFGSNAGIELTPTPLLHVKDIHSVLNPSATDVAGAIRLATAAMPEDFLKRIVLITDGNQNRGNALVEAQNAKANGIVLDVLPLEYARGSEALIDKVIVPSDVLPEEEFEVKIVVHSFQHTNARLRLYQNDQLIANQPVDLVPNRPNVFSVTRTLSDPDFYTFEAVIECDSDTIAENNRGHGFVDVKGKPKILFVSGDNSGDDYLADGLRAEGLQVTQGGLGDIPITPEQMQRWDLLILSNVPASAMTGGKNSQMAMIRDSVKSSGIGLIMIGGVNAYGAGGYKGTEIEEALPVDMDVSQKKILPSGALVLVMDAVEFRNGNAWAREICKAALDGISRRDKFGIHNANWLIPLIVASDKAKIRQKINRIQSMDVGPMRGLQEAHKVLNATSAGIKHVVVLSDSGIMGGDRGGNILKQMVGDKITISAVVIGPHGEGMVQNMQFIARAGRGNFYYPKSPEALPQIFFKEAAIVQKSLIWNQRLEPNMLYATVPLSGISPSEIPPLMGYVVTTAKQSNLVEVPIVAKQRGDLDPILAHWRYGLGKAVAFTSDAKNAWGRHWVSWPGFTRLWAQTVRWSMRPQTGWDYNVQTRIEGSEGRIVVDAVNEQGEFINFLELGGSVTSPGIKTQPIQLSQTSPGRYEASFKADEVGTYILNIIEQGKEGKSPFRTGVAVSYSPEYRKFETNFSLLKQITEATGGRLLKVTDSVFEHNLPAVRVSKPIWPFLLLAGLCLFPCDVFVRRVMIDYERILFAFQKLLSIIPVLGARWKDIQPKKSESMERLLERKREVRRSVETLVQPTEFAQGLDRQTETDQEQPVEPAPSAKAAETPVEEDTYTGRLLAAKKRALKNKKK